MPELRIHGAIFILPGPSEGEGPWQFPIGAQVGTNGVNALALLGTNVLSSPVWRVDGGASPQGEPQSISPEKCVLSYGRIQGVWYPDGYDASLSTNTAPVGFSNIATRNPSSQ